MIRVTAEIHDDLITVLNKIRELNDSGIELELPEGSVLFENILNLKLLKKQVDKMGKTLHLETVDETGQYLLSLLDEEIGVGTGMPEAVLPKQAPTHFSTPATEPEQARPKIALPKINIKNKKKLVLIGAGGLVIMLILAAVLQTPKAYAKVVVTSMPLTKSITIKAIKGTVSNVEAKSIRATTLSTDVTDSVTIPTTGTKLIGKKAKGSVTIYNKTDTEKEFKKGTVLVNETDGNELNYELTQTVTVAARTPEPEDPENPGVITYTAGTVEAKIESSDVGTKYNIDANEDLMIDDKKSSEFSAKTVAKLEGGESETVKAVADADKTKASADLLTTLTATSTSALKEKLGRGQKLIEGSVKVTTSTQNFDHAAGDQADTLTLTQTVAAQGLTYFEDDVARLVDKMSDGFIPEGFKLSDKEKEIDTKVLGQTDTSVLNDTEVDLQVTLKTFVVPSIDEEELKNELAGKNVEEAKKVLGSIQNVKTYEFRLTPNIPFLQKVPKNTDKIFVTIERE